MININNIEKNFSSDFLLKTDELHIERGERIALIGSNGSGKSTLLKLIAGVIKPDGGSMEIIPKGTKVGYEPQSPYVFKGSVEKNVLIAADKAADTDLIIKECGLEIIRKKDAQLLSGGEKQRVCFARMLCGNYPLLLLDEPLSATDIEISEKMESLLLRHCERNNTTLLIATHLPSQALRLATKLLIMNNGKIEEYSDIKKISDPESEFGRRFLSQWKIQENNNA